MHANLLGRRKHFPNLSISYPCLFWSTFKAVHPTIADNMDRLRDKHFYHTGHVGSTLHCTAVTGLIKLACKCSPVLFVCLFSVKRT